MGSMISLEELESIGVIGIEDDVLYEMMYDDPIPTVEPNPQDNESTDNNI